MVLRKGTKDFIMETFSYKKAGWLLVVLGLFSNSSYAESCSKKYYNRIARALYEDDIGCAKELIHDGGKWDTYKGFTPLMLAVKDKNKELVSLLIEKNKYPGGFYTQTLETKSLIFSILYPYTKEGHIARQISFINLKIIATEPGSSTREELNKQMNTLYNQLAQELANEEPDFDDPVAEEIYNILISYISSFRKA